MQEAGIHLSTEMFFEAVPDKFVDVSLDKWHFDENTHTIPIIIPRNYLNLYNFGFAQSRSLPKLSGRVDEPDPNGYSDAGATDGLRQYKTSSAFPTG